MQLDALAAAPGVFKNHTARADVAGAGEPRVYAGGHGVQHPQVPVAQVPPAVRHAPFCIEQSVEANEGVDLLAGLDHLELEGVIEARVHELDGDPDGHGGRGANVPRHFAQPAQDLGAIRRQRIAREGRREILLDQQRSLTPSARKQACGVAVLGLVKRVFEPGQMVLHRWDHEQAPGAGQVASRPHQRQVLLEAAVPAPALPGDGPPRPPARGAARLDLHLRLVDRPGGHGLRARLVLRDHRLQDDEGEPGTRVLRELGLVQRQLARALPDRVWDHLPEVARGEVDSVRLAYVVREGARQPQPEPLEVPRELGVHPTWGSATAGTAGPAPGL